MYIKKIILFFCCGLFSFAVLGNTFDQKQTFIIDFGGDSILIEVNNNVNVPLKKPISHNSIVDFYTQVSGSAFQPIVDALNKYRAKNPLDDWFFYQLIRYTAEKISPKAVDYHRYTLYKAFLLQETGYSVITRLRNDTMLLYTQSADPVYDIPSIARNNQQFVCLNYHDYGFIDFSTGGFSTTPILAEKNNCRSFSYKIENIPDFKSSAYLEKNFDFAYGSMEYQFSILVNKQVQKIFTNYPVVDYAYQFSIPLSKTTYQSLIPALKKELVGFNQQNGVNYLMHFTRNAFAFETDSRIYGKEKRLSAEQMLLYDYSDCEDRSAFFFFLVKEIYNLPMIVLSYPTHITVAVQFNKAPGNPIYYKGNPYWVCEPTPQKRNLKIGQLLPELKNQQFDVVYEYAPKR